MKHTFQPGVILHEEFTPPPPWTKYNHLPIFEALKESLQEVSQIFCFKPYDNRTLTALKRIWNTTTAAFLREKINPRWIDFWDIETQGVENGVMQFVFRAGPSLKDALERDAGSPLYEIEEVSKFNDHDPEPIDVWGICPICGWMSGPNSEKTFCEDSRCPALGVKLRLLATTRSEGYRWNRKDPIKRLRCLADFDSELIG